MFSDLEGYDCKRIVRVDGFPKSITADFKKVYWLDVDSITVYAAFIKDSNSPLEKVSANNSLKLKKILIYGSQIQLLPDTRCLWPHLKPNSIQVIKYLSDSIIVSLPRMKKETACSNISLATVEFTIYYDIINDNGTSDCILNLKACLQVVTMDNTKKINKLMPYTRYVFIVGVGNYYSQIEGIGPVTGDAVIHRTAPGVPSSPRNITAIPLTPNSILVKWLPPQHFNAEEVGYSTFWWTKYSNGTEEIQEKFPRKRSNSFILIEDLAPSQEYTIWVKTFPVVNGRSMPSIGCRFSENVSIETYPQPQNLILINANSSFLNISIPSELNAFRFDLELYDKLAQNWSVIPKNYTQYVMLRNLQPLTEYIIRLKIRYPFIKTSFWWPSTGGFSFKTVGDTPTPPGIPILKYFKKNSYEITWQSSQNNGLDTLIYELEGKSKTESEQNERNNTETQQYTNWTLLHNGTDNYWISSSLKYNVKYKFRVRAKNEYGFGLYSNVSEEYEIENEKYARIALWSILPMFCVIAVIMLTTLIYAYYNRSTMKKHKLVKDEFSFQNRVRDVELVNLNEIPPSTNVVKINALYIPQMEENRINDEFAQIPRILREQISLTKFLGSGAFGEVYEGKVKNLLYVNIETKVAIKALRKNATEQEKLEFLKEASLMSNFKHKHILQLLGICIDNDPNFIIMELMEGGDLLSYIRSNRSTSGTSCSLTYLDLLGICCDVVSGCCYLEELHFVHRDLACRNCLVSSKDPRLRIVKIGDFGLARDIYKNDYYRKKGEGLLPVRWMAPESLVDGVFTRHSDVWSFGVLLWEVMSLGQQPYQARSNVEVLQYVRSGGRLTCPPDCPPKLYKLMKKCWNFQPKERPTFAYCLSELENLKNDYHSDMSDISYINCTTIVNNSEIFS